jgi:hypothetical protein
MINMNGRLYDPGTGQMLSPITMYLPPFSQGFNRYTYCNNNPLKYIDPSGQLQLIPIPGQIGIIIEPTYLAREIHTSAVLI